MVLVRDAQRRQRARGVDKVPKLPACARAGVRDSTGVCSTMEASCGNNACREAEAALKLQVAELTQQLAVAQAALERQRAASKRQFAELADDNSLLRRRVATLLAAQELARGTRHGNETAAGAGASAGAGSKGALPPPVPGPGCVSGGGDSAVAQHATPTRLPSDDCSACPQTLAATLKAAHGKTNVITCAVTQCGKWLATGGADRSVAVRRMPKATHTQSMSPFGGPVASAKLESPVLCVRWCPAFDVSGYVRPACAFCSGCRNAG